MQQIIADARQRLTGTGVTVICDTGCSKADPQTNTQTGAITIHCAA